jgi:hypothetical protein
MEQDEVEIRFSFKKPVPGTTETLDLIRAEVYRRLERLEVAESLLRRAEPILYMFGSDSPTAHRLSEEITGFLAENG